MVRCQCVVERWRAIKGEIGDLIIVGRILTRNGAGFLSHSLFIRLISVDRSLDPRRDSQRLVRFLSRSLFIRLIAVRTLQEAVQDFNRSHYPFP